MRTSVIIPNYNYATFLASAIDSLLNQTDPIDEIIVVDDGSTDNSRDIIEKYDDKIISIFQKNQGQARAISEGFLRSTGDIIFILDSDDLFASNKNEIIKNIYKDNPDISWVFHDLYQQDKLNTTYPAQTFNKNQISKINELDNIKEGRLKYDAPATSGLSFKRSFITKIFPLPTADSIYISDHYIKFYSLSKSKGIHVNSALGCQVIHDNNLYTGKDHLVTRAKIFINTAYYLKDINPEIYKFCNSIFEEGVVCSKQAGIDEELKGIMTKYKNTMPVSEQIILYSRLYIKKIIGRF